jgi:hypothetical protein
LENEVLKRGLPACRPSSLNCYISDLAKIALPRGDVPGFFYFSRPFFPHYSAK